MKYNKKEKKIITDFVKKINPDYQVKFTNSPFECEIDDEIIYVGDKQFNYEGKMFMDWFEKEFPLCKDINWWIISLLHEIGHIETSTEELQEERDFLYATLQMAFNCGDYSVEEMNLAYFQIPCEYEATWWGASWWLDHKQECQDLVNFLKLSVS